MSAAHQVLAELRECRADLAIFHRPDADGITQPGRAALPRTQVITSSHLVQLCRLKWTDGRRRGR